jgi:DNA end-binding protein Ku
MRTKEYLVLVRARAGRLALTTLLWHDEVRPREIAPGGKQPAKAAVEQTVELIESMAVEWDPARYEDRYRERLGEVIERKRKGGTVRAPKPEREPAPTPDLMAALEQTLAEMKGRGPRRPTEDDLAALTKQELLERAAAADVSGRSKMSKDELVDALS